MRLNYLYSIIWCRREKPIGEGRDSCHRYQQELCHVEGCGGRSFEGFQERVPYITSNSNRKRECGAHHLGIWEVERSHCRPSHSHTVDWWSFWRRSLSSCQVVLILQACPSRNERACRYWIWVILQILKSSMWVVICYINKNIFIHKLYCLRYDVPMYVM